MCETKKYKILKVTRIDQYFIPMIDDKITDVNGWTFSTLIWRWFKKFSLSSFHATRDTSIIGNASYIKYVEVIDDIEKNIKKDIKLESKLGEIL